MVSIRLLRVEELAEVLAIQFDGAEIPTFNPDWRPENPGETVTSVCSSLIDIVENGGHQVVQFSHFSVKEYLTSERLATAEERLSYYYIRLEPAHTLLARACLMSSFNLITKSTEIPHLTSPSLLMPLDTGSTMPSLGTYHHTFRRSWNVYLIPQDHTLRHGSGYTT
jgi:hypothetical protein